MRTMVLLALATLAALAWWRWSRRTAAPTAAAAARATTGRTVASEYPSWELEMLRCDRNRAERGAILWFSDALQMELRLCLHHSKLHNDALKAQGFDRPVVAEEVAV